MLLDLDTLDWLSILRSYGISESFLQYKEGPCPICGGTGRFRYKGALTPGGRGKTNGAWFCNSCRGGDGVSLIAKVNGWSIEETFQKLRTNVKPHCQPKRPVYIATVAAKNDRLVADLQTKWDSSVPIAGTSTWTYLCRRVPGLKLSWLSRNIRHASLWYKDDDGNLRGKHPCMLARAVDMGGKPITLHRTYLTADGYKASSLGTVKKQMAGSRVINGDAIRLNQPEKACDTLIVCEGIETGLALVAMSGNVFEVWSLLNAGNLSKAQVPQRFKRVIIAADRDPMDTSNGYRPGEHYASILANRLRTEGFDVVIRVPSVEGIDFADLWLERYALRLVA